MHLCANVCVCVCVCCAGCSVKSSGRRLFLLSAPKGQLQCKKDGPRSEQYTRRLSLPVCLCACVSLCVCVQERGRGHELMYV